MIKFTKHLLIAAGLILPFCTAMADQEAVIVTLGTWAKKNGNEVLEITAKDQLSTKQRNIIGGGFTTLSQMNIKILTEHTDLEDTLPIMTVSCSVKYDAWEEYYDVATISETPQTALLKNFEEYAEQCLKVVISDAVILKQLAPQGGTLVADLIVKQTSVTEAAQIKQQLIQNQSGIMQQLFAHMLGELVLSQTKSIRVSVPPHPLGGELKFKAIKKPVIKILEKKKG